MRQFTEITKYQRQGFDVVVDQTYEDCINPSDVFEDVDVAEVCRKIDAGIYDWFMLRVRVMFEGHEFGSAYLGGCCYEDSREVLTDGTAEDLIEQALSEAKEEVSQMSQKLWALQMDLELSEMDA